jgi:putative transposase
VRYAPPAYRLRKLIGICPCCLLSAPSRESRWVSYLLKGKKVLFSNQVCSTNVQTGRKGTPTLATVIDQFNRCIVSWRPFDTMRAKEIVACARQAFVKHVTLSIMNFREGSVFGFYKYAVAARLYACGAEPEQKGSNGGTTPS